MANVGILLCDSLNLRIPIQVFEEASSWWRTQSSNALETGNVMRQEMETDTLWYLLHVG